MSLIQKTQASIDVSRAALETLVELAILPEDVTHILANIASTASAGKPLKIMHLNSIASFLAGVDIIANALPISQDEQRKANTLRVLAAVNVGPDGFITSQAAPIAQLGARNQAKHDYYADLVTQYMNGVESGQPEGQQLIMVAKKLQQQIDQAVRLASPVAQNRTAAAGPSMTGSSPSSI